MNQDLGQDALIDLQRIVTKVAGGQPRLLRIIYLRFFANATLDEIASELGCSLSRLHHIEVKTLRLLRTEFKRKRILSYADATS